MFTTFNSLLDSQATDDGSSAMAAAVKPRRNQVARACDWCRLNRVKCDDHQPCKNCQSRGNRCSNSRAKDARTLPSANREIERLEARLMELESELEKGGSNGQSTSKLISPWRSSVTTLEDLRQKRWHWRGIWSDDTHTNQAHYYGPSASVFFMHRMRVYLKEALHRPNFDDKLQPNTASTVFTAPSSLSRRSSMSQDSSIGENHVTGEDLSRSQEEYFLNLFWQSYHLTMPIINEEEFREYYISLWTSYSSPGNYKRKSSALVDIILALCMQYGTTFMPRGESMFDIDSDDSSIAGRWLYRRSQMLLSSEREAPTISTLQCHIYSAVYLNTASFSTMAHKTLAVAIRTAHILGINHEGPVGLSFADLALRKRIWWTLYILDSKACLELGRPYLIHASDMTYGLPSDDYEKTGSVNSGSDSSSTFTDITWLAFHTQCVKLIITVRSVHTEFYEKCSEIVTIDEGEDLYDHPDLLETCAGHFLQAMKGLQTWVQNVPNALKSSRKGMGEPFSTARSAIEIDPYIPLWLQRQRLLLELLYHNLAMFLYRPFVRFPPGSTSQYPISAGHSIACLNHAAVSTSIIHQVLTEADILNGWHQGYQYQWDAALSVLGFSLAHPMCPHAPSARKAIHTAIASFSIFAANNCASATSAATVTRNLLEKIDQLGRGFRNSLTSSTTPSALPSLSPSSSDHSLTTNSLEPNFTLPPQYSDALVPTTGTQASFPMMQNTGLISEVPMPLSFPPITSASLAADFPPEMFGVFEDTAWMKSQGLRVGGADWGPEVGEENRGQGFWNMDVT